MIITVTHATQTTRKQNLRGAHCARLTSATASLKGRPMTATATKSKKITKVTPAAVAAPAKKKKNWRPLSLELEPTPKPTPEEEAAIDAALAKKLDEEDRLTEYIALLNKAWLQVNDAMKIVPDFNLTPQMSGRILLDLDRAQKKLARQVDGITTTMQREKKAAARAAKKEETAAKKAEKKLSKVEKLKAQLAALEAELAGE